MIDRYIDRKIDRQIDRQIGKQKKISTAIYLTDDDDRLRGVNPELLLRFRFCVLIQHVDELFQRRRQLVQSVDRRVQSELEGGGEKRCGEGGDGGAFGTRRQRSEFGQKSIGVHSFQKKGRPVAATDEGNLIQFVGCIDGIAIVFPSMFHVYNIQK